jgi:hypothetical protein
MVRGIYIDAEVEQVPVDKNQSLPRRLVGRLARPKSDDIDPIRDVNSFSVSPLASLLQAALPLSDDEQLVANFQIRLANPDRIVAAADSLYKDMPMFNRLDPFEYIARIIWGTPKVPVFDKELEDIYGQRLLQPLFEVAGEVSLFGRNQARLESKAGTIRDVFYNRYNSMFGGFDLTDWVIRNGAEKGIFVFDADHSILLSVAEVASLWHPLSSDVRIPGTQFVTRREVFLPSELFQAKGPIIGTTRQRGQARQVPLPAENFQFGPVVILGPSGQGKSVLAESMLHQVLANNKHAAVVIDPPGKLADTLALRSITPDRLNDIYLLHLGDTENPASLSFGRGSTNIDAYISSTEAMIKAILADSYSPSYARMDDAISAFVTAIAYIPNATLFHVYKLVKESAYRQQSLPHIKDPIAQSWWRNFGELSESGREALVAPLLSRLGKLWRNKPIRNMILQQPPKIDHFSLFESGGILLISLAGKSISSEANFLFELMLAKFSMALSGRFGTDNDKRVYFVTDESQRAKGIILPDIITQYRKVGVSSWIITQGLSGWTEALSNVVLDNAAATIAFAPKDDAARLSHIFHPYTHNELSDLNPHEAVVKISVGNQSVPAFTMNTINVERESHKTRFELIKQRSNALFTRPRAQVEAEIEALLAPPPAEDPPEGHRHKRPGKGMGDRFEG